MRIVGARCMFPIGVAEPRMRHGICSVLVAGALALGSQFAIAPMAVAAEASVSHCVAPADLTRLDLPLRRTARRLASRKLIMIVALGSSSTAGAGASSVETTYPSRLMVELAQRFPTQPIMVLNRGISGERAVDMLARFDESVSAERPERCIHQGRRDGRSVKQQIHLFRLKAVIRVLSLRSSCPPMELRMNRGFPARVSRTRGTSSSFISV
jgi:hypothetical protein